MASTQKWTASRCVHTRFVGLLNLYTPGWSIGDEGRGGVGGDDKQ